MQEQWVTPLRTIKQKATSVMYDIIRNGDNVYKGKLVVYTDV